MYKCFTFKSLTVIKRLYLRIIRPKLEYAVTVWNPTSLTCINQLEKIQRRSTKFGSLAKLPYYVRLKALELSTFKTWRDRGDLIQLFRYFKGFDNINLSNAPKFSNAITRGHRLKFIRESCHHYSRFFLFFNRIASK